MTTNTMDKLLGAMPLCLVGGYDEAQHKTLADLDWLAMHELDLHNEGEIRLSLRDRRAIEAWRYRIAQAREVHA